MPEVKDPTSLGFISDEVLWLCAPLTLTQNGWDITDWRSKAKFKRSAFILLRDQVNRILGRKRDMPFFTSITTLHVIRCSRSRVRADPTNIMAGLKGVIDCLLMPRAKRPGLGLMEDDNPDFVAIGKVVDRPLGHWSDLGMSGPGTWIGLENEKLEKTI
jgi:hypothetical protein